VSTVPTEPAAAFDAGVVIETIITAVGAVADDRQRLRHRLK
jgi:hypothetical protein